MRGDINVKLGYSEKRDNIEIFWAVTITRSSGLMSEYGGDPERRDNNEMLGIFRAHVRIRRRPGEA